MGCQALAAWDADPEIDALVVADTTLLPSDELAAEVIRFGREARKPFAACWVGGEHTLAAVRRIEEEGLLVFRTAEGCADAWAACAGYEGFLAHRPAERAAEPKPPLDADRLREHLPVEGGLLAEPAAKRVLAAAGIPVPREQVAASASEAVAAARAVGLPVALKWVSSVVVHKSDEGGVKLHVETEEAVARAYEELWERAKERGRADAVEGILVQEMKPPGVELFVGARFVPGLGPVVICGLGGLWVETLGDVARRVAPLTRAQAESMWRELRGYPLLTGARGRPPVDLRAAEDVVLRVAALGEFLGARLDSLDINPLIAYPAGSGVCALDAALRIRKPGEHDG